MPSLSAAQLEQAKEAFALYDRDSDGKITTEEFGTVFRACGRNPTNAEVKKLEEEADPEGTGYVDQKTFLRLLETPKGRADDESEVKDAFRIFDKNGTGFVSVAEIRHVLTSLGEKLSAEEVDELIREAEVDSEGNLNVADFVAMLMPKKE